MKNNEKRTDVSDIEKIITQLDNAGKMITSKSIGEEIGQTAANIHRILINFKINLKPYQNKYRAEKEIKKNQEITATISKLKNLNTTSDYTLEELIKIINFSGELKEFKSLMIKEKIPYTKLKFIRELKKIDTEKKTLKELYSYCDLKEDEINLATFRTRLYEHNIDYKKDYSK